MLLAGCPSLVRKGNEIAGREKIGEGSGGCVVVCTRSWK